MPRPLESCTVDETATAFRVSPTTVRRLINRGLLPAARIGRSIRIKRAVIERLLQGKGAR